MKVLYKIVYKILQCETTIKLYRNWSQVGDLLTPQSDTSRDQFVPSWLPLFAMETKCVLQGKLPSKRKRILVFLRVEFFIYFFLNCFDSDSCITT